MGGGGRDSVRARGVGRVLFMRGFEFGEEWMDREGWLFLVGFGLRRVLRGLSASLFFSGVIHYYQIMFKHTVHVLDGL